MRFLLVDGHSAIFHFPDLHALQERRPEAARDELVRRLTALHDAGRNHVVAVFDGRGPRTSHDRAPGGIQIFYSGGKQSADHVIERLVAKYATEHEITVATNDHLVQQTALTFGGLAMSIDSLAGMMDSTAADLRREIKKHRTRR